MYACVHGRTENGTRALGEEEEEVDDVARDVGDCLTSNLNRPGRESICDGHRETATKWTDAERASSARRAPRWYDFDGCVSRVHLPELAALRNESLGGLKSAICQSWMAPRVEAKKNIVKAYRGPSALCCESIRGWDERQSVGWVLSICARKIAV